MNESLPSRIELDGVLVRLLARWGLIFECQQCSEYHLRDNIDWTMVAKAVDHAKDPPWAKAHPDEKAQT